MSQALLAIWNILKNSNIFNRSRETVLVMIFGDGKVTQFSGFLPTSVSSWLSEGKKFQDSVVAKGSLFNQLKQGLLLGNS